MSRRILRFKNGEESYPTILNEEELQTSPFSFSVNSALSQIEELYVSNKSLNGKDFSDFKQKIPNNIIAFLGNRGSGKTSCMRTTIELCKSRHKDWLILDEIDPSFFDDKHNILDIFIGTLYGIFKKEMKEWDKLSRNSQDALRRINEDFRKVKSALRYIKENIKFDDEYEIEELRHLNEGVQLSQLLYKLIRGLLRYQEKNFLVVSIDDLDLNISCSYEMLEQVRKYLILPNIAIIIAARFDQLFDNICLVLTKHYKEIPERVSQKDIVEMAERYLNKVLPLSRRFEMPLVDSYMDAVVLINDEVNDPLKESERLVSLRVPELIFKKTRFLFYNTAGIPSLVIPRNLRDLRMLVSMLVNMKDFEDGDKNNQNTFKNYFFNEWMGIIEPEYCPFIKRLLEEEDFAKLNRFVVSNLYELFLKDTESFEQLEQEIKENSKQNINTSYTRSQTLMNNILNPRNSYWNVSLGDVIMIMNVVKKSHDSAKTLSLLFVITTFYSIKLYETYNQLTDMTDDEGVKVPEEQPTTNPELKTSIRSDIPSYFRLVGGAFFSESGDTFIPREQGERESRALRIINAKFLIPEIRSVVSEYRKLENQKTEIASPRLKTRLRLCEFFMLTITERIDTKRNINRRLKGEPIYFAPFGANAKNLAFDATRPFFSSVYPKLSYDRFHNDIYNIALKENDSLLNRMRNHGESRHKDNNTWELMSKAAIRNMEILEDLTAWMLRKRDEIRPGNNGLIGALSDYYYKFQIVETNKDKMPTNGYCVKTYHKSGNTNNDGSNGKVGFPYYRIDYSIYSELGRFLMEIGDGSLSEDTKDLSSVFNAIMSEKDILILRNEYDKSEVREALYPFCGHSVVDSTFGRDNGKITLYDLSVYLAEITIEHRYDLQGLLPQELEYYYNSSILSNYSAKIEKLKKDKERLDDSISDAKESVHSKIEDLKAMKQEKAQYSKQVISNEVEANKISGEIAALSRDLTTLKLTETEDLTKAQLTALAKKRETILKNINSLEGKKEAALTNISTFRDHYKNIESRIDEVEKVAAFFHKTINKYEREIKKIEAEIERLNFNLNNRLPIQ